MILNEQNTSTIDTHYKRKNTMRKPNVFEIWDSIGRKTPFAVRRESWSKDFYAIVEKIECEKLPYGKAFGYPTDNGYPSNHFEYDKKWRKEKLIPSCGSYQWELVEIDHVFMAQEGEAADKIIELPVETEDGTNIYSLNSIFDFGRHSGVSLEAVFKRNPSYVEWAINNIDKFCLTSEAISYLQTLDINYKFTFTIETIKANQDKLAGLSSG